MSKVEKELDPHGYYPAKVGRGSVVHLAYGHGMTVCGLGTRNLSHAFFEVDAEKITCERCLKMGAKGWTGGD